MAARVSAWVRLHRARLLVGRLKARAVIARLRRSARDDDTGLNGTPLHNWRKRRDLAADRAFVRLAPMALPEITALPELPPDECPGLVPAPCSVQAL